MPDSVTPVDLRKFPRARLRLPARIRWLGPLGVRVEITETMDVSREGLRVRAKIPWGEWAQAGEILGRIVRVECPAGDLNGEPGDAMRQDGPNPMTLVRCG